MVGTLFDELELAECHIAVGIVLRGHLRAVFTRKHEGELVCFKAFALQDLCRAQGCRSWRGAVHVAERCRSDTAVELVGNA